MSRRGERTRVLYLAPWVDFGGSDKGTIDWFRWMDRERFALSLITTQPSSNRRLAEVVPYADEVWALPDLMSGDPMPQFILDFIHSRGIEVVHVMNSRLGYELLPDIHALPHRPRIVVQLHVEERDRSGYVRYVTTRFGNLVDAFSLTSSYLAEAVVEYGVTRDRIRIIPTGVEAEEEFSPDRVRPLAGLDPDLTHILYPARLVSQKNPLLMVEVVDALRASHDAFYVHVVGEGELEPDVRQAIAQRGLEQRIGLYPMARRLHEWYAACDVLLMTSEFEGVPMVLYDAMAMGLAAVVPALPGILELTAPGTAFVVDPRDDVQGYVDALARLVADRGARAKMGAFAREHVRSRFPVAGMADAHGELYSELIGPPHEIADGRAPVTAPPVRFRTRPSRGTPPVSVVIPCFNQGPWLLECIQSLHAQTYPNIEIIVVDDASTDPDTLSAVERLEHSGEPVVLRQERNMGPSAARNHGIRASTGRYVLLVDSDNLLLPAAVATLVAQLQAAGERVGFIYQNLQFFGNREDYFEAPDHNVHTLLRLNYCDTSALIDREVFNAGLWFPEDVVEGHEDWDFFLSLSERQVLGEPARTKTLLARKHGFTRSDRIDHTVGRSQSEYARRHPVLFAGAGGELKARWSPALSLVALAPLQAESIAAMYLATRIREQTSQDFELLVRGHDALPRPAPAGIRGLPVRPDASAAEALQEALRRARGRWLIVTRGSASALLTNRALVEQLLRLFIEGRELRAVVFADAGGHDLRPLGDDEVADVDAHALAWAVPGYVELLHDLDLPPGEELKTIAREFTLAAEHIEWRELALPPAAPDRARGRPLRLDLEQPSDPHARLERELRLAAAPALQTAPVAPRLRHGGPWHPVLTLPLCRHRQHGSDARLLTTSPEPVAGYYLERVLGLLRTQSLVGTVRLARDTDGNVEKRPRGDPLDAPEWGRTLGYAEEVAFNGLEGLARGPHAHTGQSVLVCGADDPLWQVLGEPIEVLGYIERSPINPSERARGAHRPGLLGLVRCTDSAARRHRYAVGAGAAGAGVWELGAVLDEPVEGATALYLDGDRVALDILSPPRRSPATVRTAKWALAPLGWRRFGQPAARSRAVVRRLASAPSLLLRPPPAPVSSNEPVGWVLAKGGLGRVPLYAAVHPVTGDQLLTRYRVEATETGYGEPTLLGYLIERAPQTGSLHRPHITIPWASRFGSAIRWDLVAEGHT